MRKVFTQTAIFGLIGATFLLTSCTSTESDISSVRTVPYYEAYDSNGILMRTGYGNHPFKVAPPSGSPFMGSNFSGQSRPVSPTASPAAAPQPVSVKMLPKKAPSKLLGEVRVRKDYLPRNARGRSGSRSMRPRYITIHSTQNWSKGADAWRHSLALKRSKLGRLSWHYTVDENVAVQHLPTNLTGRHADFDGPGNRYSIGIEMCEHPGNSRTVTVERSAKLAAYLMYKHDIPLSKVVPHYHWPRHGMNPPNKNCPHFLLDNGRPGRKWRGFQAKVQKHYEEITKAAPVYVSR